MLKKLPFTPLLKNGYYNRMSGDPSHDALQARATKLLNDRIDALAFNAQLSPTDLFAVVRSLRDDSARSMAIELLFPGDGKLLAVLLRVFRDLGSWLDEHKPETAGARAAPISATDIRRVETMLLDIRSSDG